LDNNNQGKLISGINDLVFTNKKGEFLTYNTIQVDFNQDFRALNFSWVLHDNAVTRAAFNNGFRALNFPWRSHPYL